MRSFYPGVTDLRGVSPLTIGQSQTLSDVLIDDACAYAYSGIVTLAESVLGADQGLYSWAAVKAYYATFYLIRAMLSVNRLAVFHHDNYHWLLEAAAGKSPQRSKDRSTHKLVINEFQSRFNTHPILSQPIDSQLALTWLTFRREEANYKIAKFIEPNTPSHFAKIKDIGVRQAIGAYVQPINSALAFDQDHAILAYPILTLQQTVAAIKEFLSNVMF